MRSKEGTEYRQEELGWVSFGRSFLFLSLFVSFFPWFLDALYSGLGNDASRVVEFKWVSTVSDTKTKRRCETGGLGGVKLQLVGAVGQSEAVAGCM